jgi:hypothetical protein
LEISGVAAFEHVEDPTIDDIDRSRDEPASPVSFRG